MAGFNWDDYPTESSKGFNWDEFPNEESEPVDTSLGEKIGRGALRALPVAGAMFGGATGTILGVPAGPAAIATGVAGAGLGMAAGESLKNLGEHYIFGDQKSRSDIYAGPAKAAIEGASAEMGGQVIGKVLEAGLPFIKNGADAVGSKTKSLANRFSARALGAERGTVKKIGADKIEEIGRYGLDEGILSPLASTDDMIARNAAKQSEGASKMNEVYSAIDDAGASTFNPLEVATKVNDDLGGFWRSPLNRGQTNQFENTLDAILLRADGAGGNIPLKEAQALKQELGKAANWTNKVSISDKEQMARDAYGIVSRAIDDATEAGAGTIGSEGLTEALSAGKKLYGNSKGVEELLSNKQAREQGNKLFGLTDWELLGGGLGGTIAGVATGGAGAVATAGAMAAKKGLEKYGAQNAALGLDRISKMLLKSPKFVELYQKNPAAFQSLAQSIENKIGQGAKNVIPNAADNSEDSLLKKVSDDPSKLDVLQNDRLKEQLKKTMEQRNMNHRVPIEQAQASFIQGN